MEINIHTLSDTKSEIDAKILKDIIEYLAQYPEDIVTLDYEGNVYFRDD